MAINQSSLTPRRWALAGALSVLVLGFGGLNVLTLLRLGEQDSPGLYTFRSATVGDGLLLPILAYVLIRSAHLQRPHNPFERRMTWSVGVVGAIAGMAVQVQWLLNPHPRLNWTLPSPHTFNLPGWYHAIFLVIACGFFATMATSVWFTVHEAASTDPQSIKARIRSIGTFAAFSAALGFVALLTEDNLSTKQHFSFIPIFAVSVSALLILFITCSAVGLANVRSSIEVCIASVVLTIGLSGLFPAKATSGTVVILVTLTAALVGAFSSSILEARPGADRVILAIGVAICGAGPVYWASSDGPIEAFRLTLAGTAGLILVIVEIALLRLLLEHRSVRLWKVLVLPTAATPLVVFALAGRYFLQDPKAASYSTIIGVLAAALFPWTAAFAVMYQFNPVIKAEEADAPANEISAAKWRGYLAASTVYGAALFSCIAFYMGATPGNDWIEGSASDRSSLIIVSAVAVASIVLLLGINSLQRSVERSPLWAVLTSLLCFLWAGGTLTKVLDGYGNWQAVALSIVISMVSGAFVFEGIISNTAYLHNMKIDWQVLMVAISSGLVVAITAAWMTGPALESASHLESVGFGLWGLGVGFAACMFFPYLSAKNLPGATPPQQYAPARPLAGVLQDSFFGTLMAISIAWVPNFFLAHTKGGNAWWGAVLFYLSLLSTAYVYILKNNVGHVRRQQIHFANSATGRSAAETLAQKQALTSLARHIQRQNILAAVALFPAAIFILPTQVSGFEPSNIIQIFKVPKT